MISYVTMKTASNFMRQIFSSFTNSLLIEFIDYINEKNKDKFLSSYTILYLIFCLIITPFAFFFQMVIPVIFEIWTRDKILFDPILFASMTSAFLIMIFYNPAQPFNDVIDVSEISFHVPTVIDVYVLCSQNGFGK